MAIAPSSSAQVPPTGSRLQHVARGVVTTHPVVITRAERSRVWDLDGREYLDFAGGIGAMNVGHSHPHVIAAATAQLQRLTHAAFQVAEYEPYLQVCARLNTLVPCPRPTKSILLTTGVEAVENAIKMARAYTGRAAIVAFQGAFHGRTLLGLSLTASNSGYRQNFGPFASEVYHSPYPYEYRGWTTERALDALDELFATRVAADRVAAVLIEPQLGEGGFVPAPFDFMRELRRRTEKFGIVLIVDEIQCGFGRTGRMFAFEYSGVEPDLVVLAKSLAGGLPLSAVVGRAEVVDAPAPGALGGTYGGNPVACAAALAVMDVFDHDRLLNRAQEISTQLRAGLLDLQARIPNIGDVRGLGAMLAIELVDDRERRTPATLLAQRAVEHARSRGLLLLTCGTHKNVIRCLAPLTVTNDEITKALAILESALLDARSSS